MHDPFLPTEQEIRRQSQELAVAWRRGRAGFVLDSLAREKPYRAAMVAVLVSDLLARWDPVENKWPVSFWRALLARSEGWLAAEELAELDGEYRRRFGVSPPKMERQRSSRNGLAELKRSVENLAAQIRGALEAGEPIPPPPLETVPLVEFLRPGKELG